MVFCRAVKKIQAAVQEAGGEGSVETLPIDTADLKCPPRFSSAHTQTHINTEYDNLSACTRIT